MTKFEYKTLFTDAKGFFGGKVNEKKLMDDLNRLGDEGWELVSSVASNESYGSTKCVISIFKRPVE